MHTATGLPFPVELAVKFVSSGCFPVSGLLCAEWKRALCLIRRNVCQFECDFPALQEEQKGILTFTLGDCEELGNVC